MTELKKNLTKFILSPPLSQVILTPPSTIKGSKKEKIIYSDIVCNGKKGIYLNFNSKTPEHKPTLYKFNDKNMYIYIKYTEDLEGSFMEIIDNMDVESNDLLQDKYLITGVLEKYKEDGFIKVIITNGVYSLKIGGVWRKENSTSSGFSIRALAVLVNSFYKASSEEEENDDSSYQELLNSRYETTSV